MNPGIVAKSGSRTFAVATAMLVAHAGVVGTAAAQDEQVRINYEDHIKPIFRQYCMGCHNQNRARNGLKLDSYTGMMEGGSSGPSIERGNPGNSLLYLVMAHEREPFMPDLEPKLDDEIIAQVRAWIAAGAPATADDDSYVPDATAPARTLDPDALAAPDAAPAMPEGISVEPAWWTEQPNTVSAIAASPFAPLVAVAGYRQVLLYHTESLACLGVLDFPEGDIHALRFSRDGSLVIAAGGLNAESGRVVAWDVRSGERVLELGDMPDVILAVDITEDRSFLAVGGPTGIVQVLSTATGEVLYEITKHTDWITALAFSPDGVLLATADRAGGAFVWETLTGSEFHTLPTHDGRVTAVSWRPDSQMLATAGDDARVRLLDTEHARERGSWQSHGGILAMQFDREGRIATAGRDRRARLFDGAGAEQRAFGPMTDEATAVAVTHDRSRIIVGDWSGQTIIFDAASGERVGDLPTTLPTRWQHAIAQAEARVHAASAQLEPAQQRIVDTTNAKDQAQAAVAAAEQQVANARSAVEGLADDVQQATAALDAAERALAAYETEQRRRADALAGLEAQVEAAKRARDDAMVNLAAAIDRAERAGIAHAAAQREHDKAVAAAEQDPDNEALAHARTEALARLQAAQAELELAHALRAGARAIAEQSASALAELDVARSALLTARDAWSAHTMPEVEAARAAIDPARETLAADERLQAELDAHQTSLAQAHIDFAAAENAAKEAAESLASARSALGEAEAALHAARAEWATRQAKIVDAGGRVDAAEDS